MKLFHDKKTEFYRGLSLGWLKILFDDHKQLAFFKCFVKIWQFGSNHQLIEKHHRQNKELKDYFVEIRNEMQKQSLNLSDRIEKKHTLSDSERAVFYSSWIYSAVHLMTSLDRDVDFNFICSRLKVSPEKIRQVLEFLKNNNLVIEEKGLLKNGLGNNHLEKKSPFIFKHHTNWRIKAMEKIEDLSDEELMYSVNLSLSKTDFMKLREEMVQFIQKFLKTVHASPAEDVAQLNLDFFWL